MNKQQLEYSYWERLRKNRLYGYAAYGASNSYSKIKALSKDGFLNYIEYDAKNITPFKANSYFKNGPQKIDFGMCTGVHKGDKVLRQLDWYYNNQAEFIIKMNKCEDNGVLYSSIGVTAATPRLTVDIVKNQIKNQSYNEYFDILPYMTVDGVNEKGIFAQSNVVEANGIDVDINKDDFTKIDCCCSTMLVRFILDHVGDIDELEEYLDTLHLYGALRSMVAYNNHILVADSKGNSKIIEFKKDCYEITSYHIMTNFRTNGNFEVEETTGYPKWETVESNGIGVERWRIASEFMNDSSKGSIADFEQLREKLNYTNAYVSSYVDQNTWLTDNLLNGLSVEDAKNYHDGTISEQRKTLFDNTLSQDWNDFINRSRETGTTWITTHSCIYDLTNLSCIIKSQQKNESVWTVAFDGGIKQKLS